MRLMLSVSVLAMLLAAGSFSHFAAETAPATQPACCTDACKGMTGCCKADDKGKTTCDMGGKCCKKVDAPATK